jgi:hypothetical protein
MDKCWAVGWGDPVQIPLGANWKKLRIWLQKSPQGISDTFGHFKERIRHLGRIKPLGAIFRAIKMAYIDTYKK